MVEVEVGGEGCPRPALGAGHSDGHKLICAHRRNDVRGAQVAECKAARCPTGEGMRERTRIPMFLERCVLGDLEGARGVRVWVRMLAHDVIARASSVTPPAAAAAALMAVIGPRSLLLFSFLLLSPSRSDCSCCDACCRCCCSHGRDIAAVALIARCCCCTSMRWRRERWREGGVMVEEGGVGPEAGARRRALGWPQIKAGTSPKRCARRAGRRVRGGPRRPQRGPA